MIPTPAVATPPAPARHWLLACLLATGTVAGFSVVIGAGFTAFDDPLYVTENRHVLAGLSAAGLSWAFQSLAGFWHPLTWLSLQLDAELFGPAAAGFHLTNLLLHTTTALLLFHTLAALTGDAGRSGLAAMVWAWHPLNVESVAWVTERKGLLAGFFLVLALASYTRYARRPGLWPYLSTCSAYVLGLLCKPVLVTFPVLLLIVDAWPLQRLPSVRDARRLWALVAEKVPLLLVAVGFAAVAVVAEQRLGALNTLKTPLPARLAAVPVNYLRYLGKALWPVGLAPLYPSRAGSWDSWQVAASAGVIGALTATALAARRRPYLAFSWLWFLVALAPVCGMVAVGYHDMADRYMYVPLMGLATGAVWAAADAAHALRMGRPVRRALAAGVLAISLAVTYAQASCWHDEAALWRQALAVVPNSSMAREHLGMVAAESGRLAEAEGQLLAAVALRPASETAHNNLGTVLARQGRLAEARTEFAQAVRLNPSFVQARVNLATALARAGDWPGAAREYEEALRQDPESEPAHFKLGSGLASRRRPAEAVPHLREAVRLWPEDAAAWDELGRALADLGELADATVAFREAVRREPSALYRCDLAEALAQTGQVAAAREEYRRALEAEPGLPERATRAAWGLATDPDPARRDGRLAVRLARVACEARPAPSARELDVLAGAYAENGQFKEAVKIGGQALEAAGEGAEADAVRARLAAYRRGSPYREPARGGPAPGR